MTKTTTTGYVAVDDLGDTLEDCGWCGPVRETELSARDDLRQHGTGTVRWLAADGYLYVDAPEPQCSGATSTYPDHRYTAICSALSAYDYGDGCLGIIVEHALADDPNVSIAEVRAIVDEAEVPEPEDDNERWQIELRHHGR